MPDILETLDAAIAEADSTTADLCAQFFAEAMAGVRDAIDGSEIEHPFCDSLEHEREESSVPYLCTETMARWRPPEADELVKSLRPQEGWPTGWKVIGMTVDDEPISWTDALIDWSDVHGVSITLTIEPGVAVRYYPGDHFTIESRTVEFQGRTIPAPRSVPDLAPPAREHAVILRWHHLLEPGVPEMPQTDWSGVGRRDAALRRLGPVVMWNRRGKMVPIRG